MTWLWQVMGISRIYWWPWVRRVDVTVVTVAGGSTELANATMDDAECWGDDGGLEKGGNMDWPAELETLETVVVVVVERVLCPCGNISSSSSISMMVALTGNVAAVIFCFFV